MKILIVDDSITITTTLEKIIRQYEGHEFDVTVCNNTKEAYSLLDLHEYDLLFQDVHVDGSFDGIDVAKYAKFKNIPVVIATSDNDITTIKSVAKNGFDRLIIKPISRYEVNTAIETLILGLDNPHSI